LLSEIRNRGGLSDDEAFGKRQATLGSLFFQGWVRITDDPKRRFVISDEGKAELASYTNARVDRESTAAGWSARLPSGYSGRRRKPIRRIS